MAKRIYEICDMLRGQIMNLQEERDLLANERDQALEKVRELDAILRRVEAERKVERPTFKVGDQVFDRARGIEGEVLAIHEDAAFLLLAGQGYGWEWLRNLDRRPGGIRRNPS